MSREEEMINQVRGRSTGICHNCRNRRTLWTCVAYPTGIPPAILTGEVDHTKPVIGDGGVQWEQRPDGKDWSPASPN